MNPGYSQPVTSSADLFARFCETTERLSDNPAVVGQGGRGATYTYGEVRSGSQAVATALLERRLIDHAGVGILSANCPQWPIAYLGILAAGGTVVPIDANLGPEEIAHVIKHSQMKSIICSSSFVDTVRECASDLAVFVLDELDQWASAGEYGLPAKANETAALIYTSGTTGQPKAVELTHKNLLANLDQIGAALSFGPDDIFLSVLPLHHTFEATCGFLVPLTSGCKIVYARSLNSRDLIEDMRRNGITHLIGVPLLFEKMCHSIQCKIKAAPWHRRMLFAILYRLSALGWRFGQRWGRGLFSGLRERAGMGTVRLFVSGGAPLAPRIAEFFNLIGFAFLQAYGLTETSPGVSLNCLDDTRIGSVGPPLPGVEVRISAPNSEGIGEIIVRGDNITPGYRGNPEQTAELVRDGWLHTGDLGRLHDGHLWITGRAKNLIVSAAGKNIYPEELEVKLMESELILEAVVFGRSRERRQGEDICAVLVPDLESMSEGRGIDPSNPDMTEVERLLKSEVQLVNNRLADYKRIAEVSVQTDELEKTSTKKIKRYLYH